MKKGKNDLYGVLIWIEKGQRRQKFQEPGSRMRVGRGKKNYTCLTNSLGNRQKQ
jgi:hypothetical protein